jgi:histidinol-phosphatase (PHP family)
MMLRDGHVHSSYCPHGTNDKMKDYVERAIELGYKEITFTEHAPLPKGFVDPTPLQDSAMRCEDLEDYLAEAEMLKINFQNRIKVNVGLEVDFIEGYEAETRDFLNEVGSRLDDAILSVHFLKKKDGYDCVDYSPEVFEKMITEHGSIEAVYQKYFDTLMLSLHADLGAFKPRRIGHITLIKKFHKKFPSVQSLEKDILEILNVIKEKGYELDYNGAGTAKPLCREPYPPLWVIEEAKLLQIPLVYGSDAHRVKELNQGRDSLHLG